MKDELLNGYDRTTFRRGFYDFPINLIANVHIPPIHICASDYTEYSVL